MTVSDKAMAGRQIVVDVRDDLRAGLEPFRKIMAAVDETFVGDTLVLYATFKPVPLLLLLKRHGFENEVTRLGRGDWRVDFHRVSGPQRDPADQFSPDGSSDAVAAERLPVVSGPIDATANGTLPAGTAPATETSVAPSPTAGAPSLGKYENIHLDNRGLEPPEPMVRTLQAVHKLQKGQRIVGQFDRTPMFLLPKLEEMGFVYEVAPEDDGRATVTIRHAD